MNNKNLKQSDMDFLAIKTVALVVLFIYLFHELAHVLGGLFLLNLFPKQIIINLWGFVLIYGIDWSYYIQHQPIQVFLVIIGLPQLFVAIPLKIFGREREWYWWLWTVAIATHDYLKYLLLLT